MNEELWSVFFLWRQEALSALKKSPSRLFMKEDDDDEVNDDNDDECLHRG